MPGPGCAKSCSLDFESQASTQALFGKDVCRSPLTKIHVVLWLSSDPLCFETFHDLHLLRLLAVSRDGETGSKTERPVPNQNPAREAIRSERGGFCDWTSCQPAAISGDDVLDEKIEAPKQRDPKRPMFPCPDGHAV